MKKIIVREIFKRYPNGIVALKNISFNAEEGQIVSIIGPNGAGKTTLIKLIAGLLLPEAGEITLYINSQKFDMVRENRRIKKMIGFLPSTERSFYYRLTGYQNLEFFSILMDIDSREREKRIKESLEKVGFPLKIINKLFMTYSKGEKQKLGLARTLLNNPSVILLDEPTTGLDPLSAKEIRELIVSFKKGRIIILCSHDLKEVEEISDEVIILHKGRIIQKGSPFIIKTLFPEYNRKSVKISFINKEIFEKYADLLKRKRIDIEILVNKEKQEITLYLKKESLYNIENFFSLINSLEGISSFEIKEMSLEELFVKIFGNKNENID